MKRLETPSSPVAGFKRRCECTVCGSYTQSTMAYMVVEDQKMRVICKHCLKDQGKLPEDHLEMSSWGPMLRGEVKDERPQQKSPSTV